MKMLMGKKLVIVVIFLGNRAALCLLRVSVVSKYNIRDRQQSTCDVVVGRLSVMVGKMCLWGQM